MPLRAILFIISTKILFDTTENNQYVNIPDNKVVFPAEIELYELRKSIKRNYDFNNF